MGSISGLVQNTLIACNSNLPRLAKKIHYCLTSSESADVNSGAK